MSREVIFTNKAPKAIGPYSQAIRSGDLLFVSGQIALDPRRDEMVTGGMKEEVDQIISNIKAILNVVGADLKDVVKSTIYLTDLSHFSAINQEYGKYFPHNPPARSTVEVNRLPKGANIEIEVIAAVPK